MADTDRARSAAVVVLGVALAFTGVSLALPGIAMLCRDSTGFPPESIAAVEIVDSGFVAVIAWSSASVFPVWGTLSRGRTLAAWARAVRLVYSWACLMCVFHVAVAFHVGHGWSHRRAFDHVAEVSRFGPGIFVSYAFIAIWIADVLWACASLDHYLNRPGWMGWGLLVFMAIIMFNAGIVFGSGHRQVISAVLFIVPLLAIRATRPWVTVEMREPGRRPGSADEWQSRRGHSPT